ncbi:hypothetical protein HDU88_002375 [Geranomyces variabilis]|nr:hypothetical protein HDU88_002375 [Geranomyces variabilis]
MSKGSTTCYKRVFQSSLALFIGLNVVALVVQLTIVALGPRATTVDSRKYAFNGTDHPQELPMGNSPLPLLRYRRGSLAEFPISGPDADTLWASLVPEDVGVYIGPAKSPYGLAVFHQLHCLDMIRMGYVSALAGGNDMADHVAHCFNYVRDAILCGADITLEEPRRREGDQLVVNGKGMLHTCKDWTLIYKAAQGLTP